MSAPDGDAREAVSAARARAEELWRVSSTGTAPRGPLKRLLARWTRFSVEPLAREQRAFNGAALTLVDAVSERLDAVAASEDGGARRMRELEERLTRLERRPAGGAAPTVAAQPRADALPDYFAFESRMRGSTDDVARRLAAYVDDFREAAPVLDVGCGRGELLSLLREAGIAARGVDADADMAAFARGEGHEVVQADALEHLDALAPAALGGIVATQVVEHLPPPALVRLLELAARALRPGGVLALETINPASPLALRNYFADLTHAQPLVPETLELLVRQAGFEGVETRYLNKPPEEQRLRPVELPPDPAFDAARAALAHNVERLNAQLFAPLDYAVVGRRAAG